MGDRYITIPDFANKAGISERTAYRRITKDLKPYLKIEDGKKMISEAALELFVKNIEESKPKSESEPATELTDLSVKTADMAVVEKILDGLARQIALMDQQLKEKDEQIQQITAALLKEQEIVRQAHILHAGTLKQLESGSHSNWFSRLFRRRKTDSVSDTE